MILISLIFRPADHFQRRTIHTYCGLATLFMLLWFMVNTKDSPVELTSTANASETK